MQKVNSELTEIGNEVLKSAGALEAQTNEVADALDNYSDQQEELQGWFTVLVKTVFSILK